MAEIVEFKKSGMYFGFYYPCDVDHEEDIYADRYVRESDYAALLERHRRLVHRAECALPWVESVTEYHELEAALAEEVEDERR
jgi:hypothetical protein